MNNEVPINAAQAAEQSPRDIFMTRVEHIKENPRSIDTMSKEELEKMRSEFIEQDDYKRYKDQRITIDTFEDIINTIRDEASESSDTKKVIHNLTEAKKDIQHGVSSYYRAVLRQDLLRRQVFRLSAEQYREEMRSRDQHRRNIHNSLIDDIKIFTRYINTKVSELTEINIPQEQLFSRDEIQNREMIGQWAYDSELGTRIQDIIDHIDEIKQKK